MAHGYGGSGLLELLCCLWLVSAWTQPRPRPREVVYVQQVQPVLQPVQVVQPVVATGADAGADSSELPAICLPMARD